MTRRVLGTTIGVLLAVLAAGLTGPAARAADNAPAGDEEGYVSIFNGKDLTGWDGEPRLWSVAEGVIRGQTTVENPAKNNTFCVWRGGTLRNFSLKIKFRITGGNSGIQYRSAEMAKWRIRGYQAEVEDNPGKVGFLYDEGRRGWLVSVGDIMELGVKDDGKPDKKVVGKVADKGALINAGYYKRKDRNEYTIICRGNHLVQVLNGYEMIGLIDNDKKNRSLEGVLALQIHGGLGPMVVDFKDIRIKNLPGEYGEAVRLFNGENFDGWTFSDDAQKAAWSVRDGAMVTKGSPAGYIRTEKDHTSFALRLQVRHVGPCNSGVLIRATGPDKVWPKSIECHVQKDNLGDIWNIDKFPMKTAEDRTSGRHTKKAQASNENPVGEWNCYDITMDGGRLELRVNGLLQNVATDCEEVAGKICLKSEGGDVEFRNLVLVPIEKGAAKKQDKRGQNYFLKELPVGS